MSTIEIEDFYEYSYRPQRRYGDGKPLHPGIESLLAAGLERYERQLREFLRFSDDFLRIRRDADRSAPNSPHWVNGFIPGLDAIAIYGLVASRRPRVFCEIGSGNSTKFAAAAKRAHSPGTTLVSIDPAPRSDIRNVSDTVITTPLQDCDLSVFSTLGPGDMLFLDGSHRVLQNSDVSVFFLEVLPGLQSGVLVHVHDIFWPLDYPDEWARRMYSEQYMLGMLLIFAPDKFDVILPNSYISNCTPLAGMFSELWRAPHLAGIEPYGGSFWFAKR
jgi:hypothetical protein